MKAIDLGLSVKWADRNLDASSPTDAGNLYAWAELTPKETFTWENYKHWSFSGKYGPYKEEHFNKEIHEIESCDDAIAYKYGKPWRIPTVDEFKELLSKCNWILTNENGTVGYRIYGKNNNSIFLPVCSNIYGYLDYWSATRMITPQHAQNLCTYSGNPRMKYRSRYYGFCLRGVYDKE